MAALAEAQAGVVKGALTVRKADAIYIDYQKHQVARGRRLVESFGDNAAVLTVENPSLGWVVWPRTRRHFRVRLNAPRPSIGARILI